MSRVTERHQRNTAAEADATWCGNVEAFAWTREETFLGFLLLPWKTKSEKIEPALEMACRFFLVTIVLRSLPCRR